MLLYEVQPFDHAGDFEVRERDIDEIKIDETEDGEGMIMTLTFEDGKLPKAIELEVDSLDMRMLLGQLEGRLAKMANRSSV